MVDLGGGRELYLLPALYSFGYANSNPSYPLAAISSHFLR
jgi:hypothetical protein